MTIDQIVNSQITIASPRITSAGFGTPMILSVHSKFAERLRYYADAADMLVDGFLTSDQEYIDALSIKSQRPCVERFAIGRRATPVAMVSTVTVAGTTNGNYVVTINGTSFTFAASGSTATQIRDGLIALIDAGTTGVTAASASSNTFTLTAQTAGIPFTAAVSAPSTGLTVAATTANVGIPEDLAAIEDYQPDWYGLLIKERTAAEIKTAAATIEAMRKLFFAQSADTTVINDVYPGGTGPFAVLKGLAYTRTAGWYSPSAADALAPGIMGYGLSKAPGGISWKFKPVTGVTPVRLTTQQRTNLVAKSGNGLEPIKGVGITYEGTVFSGEFIDNIHGIDKLNARIQELSFAAMLTIDKIPMTNRGIAVIAGAVGAALEESVRDGLIARMRTVNGKDTSPAWSITPPDVSDISPVDRAARRIPTSAPIVWEASLAGAVHSTAIRGTLTT